MTTLTLNYPENLDLAVHLTQDEFAAQVRLMAALKMFELGKLSSGKAAELAGLSRVEFLEMKRALACTGRMSMKTSRYGC